ncbi:MAG TPA: hypothetical protein VJO15_02325, partial [Dehalococcoidia bacterium]|nr:hypothetical protein [Dehalococcoidia bacterium]
MRKAIRQALEDFKAALKSGEPSQGPGAPPVVEEPSPSAWTRPEEQPATRVPPPAELQDSTVTDAPHVDVQLEAAPAVANADEGSLPQKASKRFGLRQAFAIVAVLGAAWVAWQTISNWAWAEPSDKNVIASYAGGKVTKEDLLADLDSHPEPDRKLLSTQNGLRSLVQDAAVHRVVERWAKERQLDEKNDVQHAMKLVAEEINLHDIGTQVHQGQIRVDEADIQKYYEENREKLGNRPLAEVRDAIRDSLHAGKEKEYIESYLSELRARASVAVDYQLLLVPEPTEEELSSYYLSRQAEFREPERVRVQEIRFEATSKD